MNYDEFSEMFGSEMKRARSVYQDESKGTPVICNGMDADCEAFIDSEGYLAPPLGTDADNSFAEIAADFGQPE